MKLHHFFDLRPFAWDETLFSWINSIGKERLDYLCGWPTYLGDPVILIFAVTVFVVIWDPGKIGKKIAMISVASLSGTLLAQLVKHIVYRVRPYEHFGDMIELGQYRLHTLFELLREESSFPSGHTATVFAMATVLTCIYGRRFVCIYLLAVFVGFTRIYVGLHFPSDVLAGAVVGTFAGYVTFRLWPDRCGF